jgi:hypothetical protein
MLMGQSIVLCIKAWWYLCIATPSCENHI